MSKQSRTMRKLCDGLMKLGNHYIGKFSLVNGDQVPATFEELELALNMSSLYTWILHFDEFKQAKMLYHRFDLLDVYINSLGFSSIEKAELVFEIMKRNIAMGLLEDDATSITEGRKCTLSYEKLLGQFRKPSESYMQSFERVFLATIEPATGNSFSTLGGMSISNFDNLKHIHMVLNKHVFNNPSISEKDIAIVMKTLKSFLLDQTLDSINLYLESKIEMQEKKKQDDAQKEALRQHIDSARESTQSRLLQQSQTISKREYNTLYYELQGYFDIEHMRATKYLKVDEIIRCLIILRKLSFSDDVIQSFLITVDVYNKKSRINAVTRYLDVREKLEYYQDNLEIKKTLKDLNEAFAQLFIANDDDYEFLKQYLDLEVQRVLDYLEGNYAYEHQKVLTCIEKKDS